MLPESSSANADHMLLYMLSIGSAYHMPYLIVGYHTLVARRCAAFELGADVQIKSLSHFHHQVAQQ